MFFVCCVRWIRVVLIFAAIFSETAAAEPNTTGQTGLINMPDARIAEDGTLRFGASYFRPYLPIWSSITLLPRLELSGRYTIVRGLSSGLGQGFPIFPRSIPSARTRLRKREKILKPNRS